MTEITRNQQNFPSRLPEAVAIVASLLFHVAIAVTLRWNLTPSPTRPSGGTVKVVELTSNELNRLPPSVQRTENNPPPTQPDVVAIQPPPISPLPTPLVPNPPPNVIPNAPNIVSQPTPTPSPSPSRSTTPIPTPSPSPSRQPIPNNPSVRTPTPNTPSPRRDPSPSTPLPTPRDYSAPRPAAANPSLPSPSPSPSITTTTSPSPTPRTSIFIPPPGSVVPPSGFNPPVSGGSGNGSGNTTGGNPATTPPIILPTTPPTGSDNSPGNSGNGRNPRQPNVIDGGETLSSLYQNALRQETTLRQRYPGLISRQPRDLSIPYPPGVPCQPNTLHAIVYMVVIDEKLDPDTTAIVGTQSIRGRTNLSQQAVSKATDVLSELLANNDTNPGDRIRNPADGNNPVLVSFRVKYKCNN